MIGGGGVCRYEVDGVALYLDTTGGESPVLYRQVRQTRSVRALASWSGPVFYEGEVRNVVPGDGQVVTVDHHWMGRCGSLVIGEWLDEPVPKLREVELL